MDFFWRDPLFSGIFFHSNFFVDPKYAFFFLVEANSLGGGGSGCWGLHLFIFFESRIVAVILLQKNKVKGVLFLFADSRF